MSCKCKCHLDGMCKCPTCSPVHECSGDIPPFSKISKKDGVIFGFVKKSKNEDCENCKK